MAFSAALKAAAEKSTSTITGSKNTVTSNHCMAKETSNHCMSKETSNYKQCSLQGGHKVLKQLYVQAADFAIFC